MVLVKCFVIFSGYSSQVMGTHEGYSWVKFKPFVYGGLAACLAEFTTFPIDTVKTRLQLQVQGIIHIYRGSRALSVTSQKIFLGDNCNDIALFDNSLKFRRKDLEIFFSI